ncbi:MAG: hypothetical protein ACQ9MH_18765 [Nitrospinales bacterium]
MKKHSDKKVVYAALIGLFVAAVDRIEMSIKAAVPAVTKIFIEAQSLKKTAKSKD